MTSTPDHQPDESEAWLDSLLDEVLGGQRPPDLKTQILQDWKATVGETPSAGDPADVPSIRVQPRGSSAGKRRWTRRLTPGSIAGIACLIALIVIFVAQRSFDRRSEDRVVAEPDGLRGRSNRVVPRPTLPEVRRTRSHRPADRSPAAPALNGASSDDASTRPDSSSDVSPASPATKPLTGESTESSESSSPGTRWARLDSSTVISRINQQLGEGWERRHVTPAPPVADASWCQRVFLQLVGRPPNAIELRDFLRDTSPQRKTLLVDHLLGDQHAQEFASHWSRRWSGWLLPEGLDTLKAIRRGLQDHLATELESNESYDDICAQLISATGTNDPSRDDFDGATNFLLALNENATDADATAQLCRVIMGQRASCARCHDDALRQRSQREFWQLAATMGSVEISVLRPSRGRLADVDRERRLALQFHDQYGQTHSASPGDLTGERLSTSSDASLRTQLAAGLVASDDFSQAAVNRFWAALLNYGFTLPVDDMGRHNPVSDPELVDLLSSQFVMHGYDLRQLLRWIALSDAFDRSDAITPANIQDAPTAGGAPLFSRFYYRPVLFAEPKEGLSLLAAGGAPQATYGVGEERRQLLNARRQRDPRSKTSTAPRSDVMGQLLPSHYLSLIRSLAAANLTREQQFEHAFMVVQTRAPTEAEQAEAEAIWQAADGVAVTALERLFWSLLNTRGS